jgi:protein SCO1/2
MTRFDACRILLAAALAGALAPAAPAQAATAAPPDAGIGVDEHLGAQVPPDLVFSGPDGRPVRLGSLFRGKAPIVLILAYDRCPMLCGLVMKGATDALRSVASPEADGGWPLGDAVRAVNVSFDPQETPAASRRRQATALERAGLPASAAAAWPFLTGSEDAIRALAGAVGFRYRYVPESGDFAHPAAIVVLTPEGRVARYLYGVEYPPRQLRLALAEAAEGRAGSSFDRFLLRCYRYDPALRRYAVPLALYYRIGSGVLLFLVGGLLVRYWRRERRASRPPAAASAAR